MALGNYGSALVTGASKGIGAAVVRALCAEGITVHAAARHGPGLERLAADTGCIVHLLDLTDTQAVHGTLGELDVDILISNAAAGPGFDQGYKARPEHIDTILETNVLGAIQVVRAIVPGMVARQRGHVVNIGSIAGLYPMKSSIYGASKAALHLLSQNLRIELQGSGVRVTEICPGQTDTGFFEGAFEDPQAEAAYMQGLRGMRLLRPDDVANAILYALNAPWHVNVSLVELTPIEQVPGGLSNVLVSARKPVPS